MYKQLFALAKENQLDNFQICKITKEELIIETFNNKIDKYEISNIENYLVSAIYQNKAVRLQTEYLDNSVINTLKAQTQYLDIITSKKRTTLENIKEQKSYKINDPASIITRMLKLVNLKKQYKSLIEINGYYTESIIQREIVTEKNNLYDTKKVTSFAIDTVVGENGKNSTANNSKTNLDESPIDMEKIAHKTIQNAIDKLSFKEIENGNYQVILTSKVMGSILNKFTQLFSADSIQKDTSLLVGKLNKQVFSSKITIVEDPCNPKLLGKRLFDDTGIKTSYKEIIKNGIFIQALYDERTATMDNVRNTGNDYGEISPRNMYILPGNKSLDELIKSVDKGVVIDAVGGLHSGINPINGDISIQSEGYYIKNGKKQYASKLFVFSTNIMDILNNVIDISNHIEFYSAITASPDLLVDDIKISK